MNEIHQQETHKGFNINIYRDESPESPRDWDNLGTMYTMHRNYQPEKSFSKCFEWNKVFDENRDILDSFDKKYIALKFYLYDHSGITVSTSPFSCPWDSGLFGIIAVDVEKVKKEYNWKKVTKRRRAQIESYLESEVELYDNYCTGEIYRYEITPIGDANDSIDSCDGFFGDDGIKSIISGCKVSIDSEIKRIKAEKRQKIIDSITKYGRQLYLFPEFETELDIEFLK